MINKTLFVYNSLNLFKILHEIKENLYFEIKHIDQKDYKKVNFEQYENYLIISTNSNEKIQNCIIINNLPIKITKIVEIINLSFLKIKFKNQSKHKIGKYTLDLNSRKIYFEDIQNGKIQIVIGTHSLIQNDIQFKKSVLMATAIWNGSNKELNGQKGIAGWLLLRMS